MSDEIRKTRSDFSTDSEWYTYLVTHEDLFEEKNDEISENTYEKGIFVCEKCGYIIDETENGFEKKYLNKIKRDNSGNILKCPNCHASSISLKRITKKDKEKRLLNKRKKEEKDKLRLEKIAKENIKDDMLSLLDDLKIRLDKGEIDINRLTVLFINLSKKIIDRNSKDIDIDWLGYRKAIYTLADTVIDLYNVKQDAETIVENYDQDIKQDKLYLAEYKYYIEDDKYSIADYEMSERVKEYENIQSNIFLKEKQRELEKTYQQRRVLLEQKADERLRRRTERYIN